jgi:hypothetical protein
MRPIHVLLLAAVPLLCSAASAASAASAVPHLSYVCLLAHMITGRMHKHVKRQTDLTKPVPVLLLAAVPLLVFEQAQMPGSGVGVCRDSLTFAETCVLLPEPASTVLKSSRCPDGDGYVLAQKLPSRNAFSHA